MHSEIAAAKVNLSLHVTGQTSDGYHLLQSLVAFADVGDRLFFEESSEPSLAITGPFANALPLTDDNLIYRALDLMGRPPLKITLEKNLPVAAGIGGGSADAAAALRGLSAVTGRALPALDDLMALGADVPVCIDSAPCMMSGKGEEIIPLPDLGPFHAVLVNLGVGVSTAQVFSGLRSKSNAPMPELAHWDLGALSALRNDLEAPALTLCPQIADCLSALKATEAGLARMSGSGATCFGIYPSADAATLAATSIKDQHPNWWVKDCLLA